MQTTTDTTKALVIDTPWLYDDEDGTPVFGPPVMRRETLTVENIDGDCGRAGVAKYRLYGWTDGDGREPAVMPSGYHDSYYFDSATGEYLGPDKWGVEPIYVRDEA